MGQTLFLDCFAGISGDMMVGCLLDLGADQDKLRRALESLSLEGYRVEISRVQKAGLDMCDFSVVLDDVHENHDHDMDYLHGNSSVHEHFSEHVYEQSHGHFDDYTNEQSHGHFHESSSEHFHNSSYTCQNAVHAHHHRGLLEINEIIRHAELSEKAKKIARNIFDVLGEAEAKAHGVSKDEVHFHEVGAVDSIVDIVAVAVCLEDLEITRVIVPYLCEGRGTVRCQHGIMPVPVPAVVHIVKSHQLVLQPVDVEGELVTPTGAAIVAAVRTKECLPRRYRVLASGMGAGKRNYSRPSILRGMLIQEEIEAKEEEQIWKLESNVDDCSGEAMGYVLEKLLKNGARDVHYIPVFMKKNRPAYLLNVICREDKIALLEKIIFENTTTIGVRKYPVERTILPRQIKESDTSYGKVEVKVCILPDGTKRVYPEYESIRQICQKQEASYWEVYQDVIAQCFLNCGDF